MSATEAKITTAPIAISGAILSDSSAQRTTGFA
jgi:hypothetical protein